MWKLIPTNRLLCRSHDWRLRLRTYTRVCAHHTSEQDLFGGNHHVNVSLGDNNVVNMLEQVRLIWGLCTEG